MRRIRVKFKRKKGAVVWPNLAQACAQNPLNLMKIAHFGGLDLNLCGLNV
ncbi:hypothetical protein CAMRE0001_0127 [Campylobacter rectus RM3267]|uniref:Uncharacterized protein n=1 Tax=Campylobacter rectus RM3267 TaxID=553218 RepID=B9CXT8_CAMRE|nr:hypothetical protein CAMRE0001_0127 [Campylobacter rectus RM3267]